MVKKLTLLVALVIGILIIPILVFAVDYSIERCLFTGGWRGAGTEQDTYQLDGKFNGITVP